MIGGLDFRRAKPRDPLLVMAIRTRRHGQGIGAAILEWALAQLREQGRRCLRLGCQTGNRRLRRYGEDKGFNYRGQVTDRDDVTALNELAL